MNGKSRLICHGIQKVESPVFPPDPSFIQSKILDILELHRDDIEHIQQYITDQGYCNGGGSNFSLPADLQIIWDEITNQIIAVSQEYAEEYGPYIFQYYLENKFVLPAQQQELLILHEPPSNPPIRGGGYNAVSGPHLWLNPTFCEYGIYWDVWLDDDNTKKLGYVNLPILLISALGPVGIIIAAIITAYLVYLQNANEGNGIYFKAVIRYIPYPGFFCADAQPQ